MNNLIKNFTKINYLDVLKRSVALIALILICILMTILSDVFLSYRNLIGIIRQVAVFGFLAIGETLVVVTGEIDLSIGSIVGISGVVVASLLKMGIPFPICILIGIAVGIMIGLINGLVISRGKVPSFVATLGMMGIARGAALLVTNGRPISGFSPDFTFIGGGELWFIPMPILLLFVAAFIMHVILKRTNTGRHLYAVGGSRKAAFYSGINVKRELTKAFILSGIFAAIGGVVLTARLDASETVAGKGFELIAIASVVIGGASLSGGKGTIINTILGTITIGVIQNGMTLLAIQAYWQEIVQGVIIILAVMLNSVDINSKVLNRKRIASSN